jgi:8-oxo-dGTP pyrophosphatase MutT (NUDIX family)
MEKGLHVVAVAAVVIDRGRVLAMRRAPENQAGAGFWETLSGRIEPGEEPIETLVREIAEECALEVEVETRPFDAYAAIRNGHPMIVVVYRARYLGGVVTLSDEHDAYAWLSADEFAARSTLARLVASVRRALRDPL